MKLETVSIRRMLQSEWESKAYAKNGLPLIISRQFSLTFTDSQIVCDNLELMDLWPPTVNYENINGANNNYFYRGDGLIFEIKSIDNEELVIDLLEKDFKTNDIITHQFQFIKKPD